MLARKVKIGVLAVILSAMIAVAGARSALAANQFVVDYRMSEWKAAHFDDIKSADTHYATVTKLGCEAKKGSHGGHYDVNYVCPQWRRIALKNHEEAHQWEKWLKANGFETKHSH